MSVKTRVIVQVESIGGDGQVLAELTTEQADLVAAVMGVLQSGIPEIADPGSRAAHGQGLRRVTAALDAAERQRVTGLQDLAKELGLDQAWVDEQVGAGTSIAAAREAAAQA